MTPTDSNPTVLGWVLARCETPEQIRAVFAAIEAIPPAYRRWFA